MFSSGNFGFVNLPLCYIVVSVEVGCLLSQPPLLRLKTNITHFSPEIECDITGFTATKIRFYENLNEVVNVSPSGRSCAKWFMVPSNFFDCTCIVNMTAGCTIDVDWYGTVCPKWQCAVLDEEGVLHFSNYINVCNSNKDHLTTKIIGNANCSGRIPFRVKWTIFGLNIKYNMIIPILKTFTAANISFFVDKYTSYQHTSISTCTFQKRVSEDWNLRILDSSLLCSSNSDMPNNKTCKATDGNPMVTVIREPYIRSQCQSIRTTPASDMLTLCEAVNRKDLGAERFVGNMTGLFKLEILVTASVMEFFVEGFNNQTHITFNETTQITLRCQGDGFPPPTMQLLKNGIEYSVGNSPFRPTMKLNGSQDTGNYTCIAANALGKDGKTVYISCHINMDNHQDQPLAAAILNMKLIGTILAGAGALLLLVIIVSAACGYRLYKRMKTTENVVWPMTHLTTTTPTGSSIPLSDPTLIYNEIDPHIIDPDRQVEDDDATNVSQYSFNAAAVGNEGINHSPYLDESPMYLIVTAD